MEAQLNSSVKRLAQLIVTEPCIESAFLGALGNMEEVASREIVKTINDETPKEFILEIIQHAQDEHRHAFLLRAVKPVKDYQDVRYYHLERKLSELGINFVLGFFGQKLLLKARSLNRFAGYILGALTIEQVPLQLYTGYLKATKVDSVRRDMPAVLKDEFAHLELGKKFYKTLPPEQQFNIDQINAIELEMCDLLARKMYTCIETFRDDSKDDSFESYLCEDRKRLALWITLLSQVEKERGHDKTASELLHSVLFISNKAVEMQGLNAQETLETLKSAQPSWLKKHYKNLAEKTNLIGVCYALEKAYNSYVTEEVSDIHFNNQIQKNFEAVL